MERIRGSTNPVFRLLLSDGEKSFGVFAKRPAVYPENNEALSEYKNYTDFNLSRSGPVGKMVGRIPSTCCLNGGTRRGD